MPTEMIDYMKRKEDYLFTFIFTKTISNDELELIMNTALEEEDFERCGLIKSLKDKGYFEDVEERDLNISDYIYELSQYPKKLKDIEKNFENGYIEQEEALSTFEKIKEDMNGISIKMTGVSYRDVIRQFEQRISNIKRSKSPFKFFSDDKKVWNSFKDEALKQMKEEKLSLETYIKNQLR
jgi:hypothetical protein